MPQLSVMLKPSSSMCNMRCKYCFYHSLAASREHYGYGFMSRETAYAVIEKSLDFAAGESVYFSFQGGEPLLSGKDFFQYFVDTVNRCNKRGSKIYYALQTNGTLIDGEWAEFFVQNGFLVGLSCDGGREDSLYRLKADYSPAFNDIEAAAEILKRYNVQFNILAVVTGRTAKNIERVYNYFKEKGYGYLQFIPCLRPFSDHTESELYMTVDRYAEYLIRLFNMYVKDYVRGQYVSIRYFDNLVRMYLGQAPEQCGINGHCSHQFVIEGNGNVYPCDFYCTDEWLLGNVNECGMAELAVSPKAVEFIRSSLPVPEKCRTCRYYGLCRGGGCRRSRQDRDYCGAYRIFFDACLPLFRVFADEKPR